MTSGTATATPPKPLLRGVLHEAAAGIALAAGILLAASARGPAARAAAVVYGGTLFALFLSSALYHRPAWSPRARLLMRRIDHSAIFLLIAGTYTPFCVLLGGRTGWSLLAVVWVGALLGIVRAIVWVYAPKAVAAGLYLLLGWAIVPVLPALRTTLGAAGVAMLAAGGIAYSAGAVIYATRRPDPFPAVFGYHEVFHALVVVAAALHFAVVTGAVRAIGA